MSSDQRASSYLESGPRHESSTTTYLERGRPREDRLQGEYAESLFRDFLTRKGRHPESNPGGYHPEWDVTDGEFTYEVKLDRLVQETGNVYIERKSLFNSKSDYFVYLFQRDVTPTLFIFMAPSAKVRNFWRRYAINCSVTGGDFREPGILLRYDDFAALFKPIGYCLPNQHPHTQN